MDFVLLTVRQVAYKGCRYLDVIPMASLATGRPIPSSTVLPPVNESD